MEEGRVSQTSRKTFSLLLGYLDRQCSYQWNIQVEKSRRQLVSWVWSFGGKTGNDGNLKVISLKTGVEAREMIR